MDVRLTRDGVPVVIRDSRLLRLCGGGICVEDSTREELRNYFLSKPEERIPDLREALELVDGQVPVLLDLKPEEENYGMLCSRVSRILDGYDWGFFAPRTVRGSHGGPLVQKPPSGVHPGAGHGVRREVRVRAACTLRDFIRHNLLTNFLTAPILSPAMWRTETTSACGCAGSCTGCRPWSGASTIWKAMNWSRQMSLW